MPIASVLDTVARRRANTSAELQGLVRKTSGLVDVLSQALQPLAAQILVACVYGSVARGGDSAQSDVDVLLIGDLSFADALLADARVGEDVERGVLDEPGPLDWVCLARGAGDLQA